MVGTTSTLLPRRPASLPQSKFGKGRIILGRHGSRPYQRGVLRQSFLSRFGSAPEDGFELAEVFRQNGGPAHSLSGQGGMFEIYHLGVQSLAGEFDWRPSV